MFVEHTFGNFFLDQRENKEIHWLLTLQLDITFQFLVM